MTPASLRQARSSLRRGSKSFAAAALLFDRHTRRDATLLYAWCRHCDDVIDGQALGHGCVAQSESGFERLRRIEQQTSRALAGEPVAEPAFAGLQHVVHRHEIPRQLANLHLAGFRMDVEGRHYRTIEDTLDYCYHVAGVVGLMMAHVMGVRCASTLERACDLGIAFQLTNIARDLVDDALAGRLYVPQDWLDAEGISVGDMADPAAAAALARLAAELLSLAQRYYASARVGIGELPLRSAWAIATARAVYQQIGVEILARGEQAWVERVRTTRLRKTALIVHGGIEALQRRRQHSRASADQVLFLG